MSQLDPRLSRLKEDFPDAIDIRHKGVCHCKRRAEMFFLWRTKLISTERVKDGKIVGACYCVVCDFSNSCRMSVDEYNSLTVVADDLK